MALQTDEARGSAMNQTQAMEDVQIDVSHEPETDEMHRASCEVEIKMPVHTEDENKPFKAVAPIQVQLRETFTWQRILIIGFFALVSVILAFTALKEVKFLDGAGNTVPAWKPLFVMNLLIAFVVLVLAGGAPEAILVGLAAISVAFGCLAPEKLFKGASSSAVTTLALLFPIAKALDNTGWPSLIVGKFLGSPDTQQAALARVFISVALLSGIFNNTPIVSAMIPVMMTFCQRLQFEPRVFLLPLSYAAQAGGSLTLMGSSVNFMAKQVFADRFEMGFLHLTMGGAILCIVTGTYCALVAPWFFDKSAPPAPTTDRGRRTKSVVAPNKNVYNIEMSVVPQGPLCGKQMPQTGIHRIKGVHSAHLSRARASTMRVSTSGYSAGASAMIENGDTPQDDSPLLCSNDCIRVQATADGVAALRHVQGLELGNEHSEVQLLGAQRRTRRLMEAVVGEELVGTKANVISMRHKLGCAIIGLRRSKPMPWLSTFNGIGLEEGDVLLIESFKASIGSDMWVESFGVVRIVENSQPNRSGRTPDTLRAVATAAGLFIAIGISMTGVLRLDVLCALLLCLLIFIKAMDVQEAYSTVNAGVLLTIIGATALGDAVQDTGLANFLADGIVVMCQPMGQIGILAGLYVAAAGLSLFVSNAAAVAILAEIGIKVADSMSIPVTTIALVIVYAASACWMSPYGYQTNLMVMPYGNYTWGDFVKFGMPLQVLHMIVCVLMAPFCGSLIGNFEDLAPVAAAAVPATAVMGVPV